MRAWGTSSSRRWPTASTTTYTNTPIQISFLPAVLWLNVDVSSDAPVVISGVLNGVVNGPSSSTVTATFNSPPNGLFSLGSGNGTAEFSLPTSTLLLAPSTSNNGTTSAQGLVTLTQRPVRRLRFPNQARSPCS